MYITESKRGIVEHMYHFFAMFHILKIFNRQKADLDLTYT